MIKLEGNNKIDFEAKTSNSLYPNEVDCIRNIKQAVATAPDYTPKNFFEQIVFYESGGVKKLYLYINNAWIAFTSD